MAELPVTMSGRSLRGFGVTVDLATGRMRNWYAGADGIKRWADTDQPVDTTEAADREEH